jgi:hypothetical protein
MAKETLELAPKYPRRTLQSPRKNRAAPDYFYAQLSHR